MKFSHSIQFNAVPDWSSHYIAYSNLKKLIFSLEKEVNQRAQRLNDDPEASPLLEGSDGDPDKAFSKALDAELKKIVDFYDEKEAEIFHEVEQLMKDEEAFEADHEAYTDAEDPRASQGFRRPSLSGKGRQSSIFQDWGFPSRKRANTLDTMEPIESEESDEDADEQSTLKRNKTIDSNSSGGGQGRRGTLRRLSTAAEEGQDSVVSSSNEAWVHLKKRLIKNYVSLCELRSFIELNKTGFRKVLKKYDKILDRKLKDKYTNQKVNTSGLFKSERVEAVNKHIESIEKAYANLNTRGNVDQARRELRLDLREHVVWERNTVWRDMIGIERKAQAANLGVRKTLFGNSEEPDKIHRQGDSQQGSKESLSTFGKYNLPAFMLHSSFWALVVSCVVFVCLLGTPILEIEEQQNCLAVVVFVSILWATEAIPLFVTSLLVPALVVMLRIVRTEERPYDRLSSKAAASFIFSAMWTPVIMLLLGGFTIAAALSKYNVAKIMATFVLSKAGTRPRNVLLVSMFVSMFLSMWISNVASPVLCFSILQPILRNLPRDSAMIKALLLGVALSANIGGAASPIASPQNLIALENMAPEPGWGVWFFIALPVCVLSVLCMWLLLLVTLNPGRGTTIVPIRPMKDKLNGTQWFIIAVTLLTIVLWCVTHQIESVVGDMGVVAILPLVLFFGTGVLTKEDFNNFLWTIIILAAGGLALGKAVNSSGLLQTIATGITERVQDVSLYKLTVIFAAMVVVVASFISHTVAALIILPLVREVGQSMSEPHPNLLVMSSVLMCSAAMALPTSGFPNMTAIMMEDPQTGQRYLQVRHFITRGIPASLICFVIVVSVGYGLMRVSGL